MKTLFINHGKTQCGVYEFGRNIGRALEKSPAVCAYREIDSNDDLRRTIKTEKPRLIFYNYHPATMPWLDAATTARNKCVQIGLIHEVTQQTADAADNGLFNFHIAHDPTLLLRNPLVFKAGRLIPPYQNRFAPPTVLTVGSFGFGTPGKGFEKIVEMVQREFDRAVIRFNIPFAAFGDADGKNARQIAENCRKLLFKPNVELQISHDFLDQAAILDFLASNTINVFLYEDQGAARGISSATDLALAANRPVAISLNSMFRHLFDARPSICIIENSLARIIENDVAPLEKYRREWSEECLRWDYARIANEALARREVPPIAFDNRLRKNLKRVKRFVKRRLGRGADEAAAANHSWISDTSIKKPSVRAARTVAYSPAKIPAGWSLNNILDDKARSIFHDTIAQMFEYLPDLMRRKIAEANVQQAFVLDTVYKIVSPIEEPKILSVGSFEDSACESLKLLGYSVEEVDPMINYDLETFVTKPTTVKNSYDAIFSTSVIEHVEHDAEFLRHIAALLKPGGVIILTCDFLNSYQPGDPKPTVDFRFYTEKDLKERLLPKLADCRLTDEPQWNCAQPDFYYDGFNYTFAAIVLRKIEN